MWISKFIIAALDLSITRPSLYKRSIRPCTLNITDENRNYILFLNMYQYSWFYIMTFMRLTQTSTNLLKSGFIHYFLYCLGFPYKPVCLWLLMKNTAYYTTKRELSLSQSSHHLKCNKLLYHANTMSVCIELSLILQCLWQHGFTMTTPIIMLSKYSKFFFWDIMRWSLTVVCPWWLWSPHPSLHWTFVVFEYCRLWDFSPEPCRYTSWYT